MSLINKMLRDLEARQTGARTGRPIFQDLQPVAAEQRRSRGMALAVVAAIALAGAAVWWILGNSRLISPAPTAATPVAVPAPVATPELPAAPTVAAPPVAVSPAPVVAAPAAVSKARPAPKVVSPASPPRATRATETSRSRHPVSETAAAREPDNSGPARIEKTERPYTPEEIAEHAYQEARQARDQGNRVETERQLRAALAANPKQLKAREMLAEVLAESGRDLEAQELLRDGMSRVPGYLPFRLQLARLLLARGDDQAALTLLEQARTGGVRDPDLFAFLAVLYQRTGRSADAAKAYQDALGLRPDEGRWWVGFGIALEGQKDTANALNAYRRALETGRLTGNLVTYAEGRIKALASR